jgi:phage-related baseplate assembly protein
MTINSNRFLAPVINPAQLPAPNAIEPLDVERLLSERMEDFQTRADQAGFPYDVGGLETDPIKIDQEAHAYRELLMRARVNSAIRAVLPAYAQGADLEAIAARANVTRQIVTPANPTTGEPAVYETDAALLVRYLTSFAVPSAGSEDGYIYRAITAAPTLRDVAVVGPETHGRAGRAEVYLLSEGGLATPSATVDAVRAALSARNAKPLTDWLVVAPASITAYSVEMVVTVPPGPAPQEVAAAVRDAVRKAADARYVIGASVWPNALQGAAYVGNVTKVTGVTPLVPIQPGPSGAAYCSQITINIEVSP